MDFATAVEGAIRQSRARGLVWAFGGCVFLLVLAATGSGYRTLTALIAAICIWPVALFTETKGVAALKRLRGAEPEHWLASTSHGLVAITREFLLVGDVRVEFDPHARRRVTSAAYDESTHTLLIGLMNPEQREGRPAASQTIVDVRLDPSVPPERASIFASKALELSQP